MDTGNALASLAIIAIIMVIAYIAINIYAIVLISNVRKLLYGKGTILGIIAIVRLLRIIDIAYGKKSRILFYIAFGVSLISGSLISPGEEITTPIDVIAIIADLIVVVAYFAGIVITTKKYKLWKKDEKERENAKESLKRAFLINDTPTPTEIEKNNDVDEFEIEDDSNEDNPGKDDEDEYNEDI